MHRMVKRYNNPDIMKPAFHPGRLNDLKKLKEPSFIFTGSSGDMWGDWVCRYWLLEVFSAINDHTQHTFQFLTKNPKAYSSWCMSDCWCGTTVDGFHRVDNIKILKDSVSDDDFKFVSFEPLLTDLSMKRPDLSGLDWIIIGANSNRGAKKPPDMWAAYLIDAARELGIPVWMKDNYGYPERIKERPEMKGV
jgi:protein gp37